MVKIIEMFIPKTNKKTRPGTKRTPRTITIHETDNPGVRANALAHAKLQKNGNTRQASWHLQVDDEVEVYQSVPFNEVAYAAGDGSGPGNSYSIHIEMCVNSDGDYKKTVSNTIQVVKWLINKYPSINNVDVVQHNKWSGKNCPRYLRSGAKGIDWKGFIAGVKGGKTNVTKPLNPPKYTTSNNQVKVNQKVTLKSSATHYATGEKIPAKFKGKKYTVQQRGSNRVLLKELYSWVKISDLEGKVGASKPVSKPKVTGSVVDYLKSKKIDSSFTNREKLAAKHGIKNYKGTESQNVALLNKLQGSTPKPSKPKTSYKVGSTVTLKKSASKFATGQSILDSAKGKRYKIIQTKSDRVLLDKIMSWVKKSDVQ